MQWIYARILEHRQEEDAKRALRMAQQQRPNIRKSVVKGTPFKSR